MSENPIKNPIKPTTLDGIMDLSISEILDAAEVHDLPYVRDVLNAPDPPQVVLSPTKRDELKRKMRSRVADWLVNSHS